MMDVASEQALNERTYRRLKTKIDRIYPGEQYVAIVRGKIVADAPTFRDLIVKLSSIESDPERRLIVQAGVEYPRKVRIG